MTAFFAGIWAQLLAFLEPVAGDHPWLSLARGRALIAAREGQLAVLHFDRCLGHRPQDPWLHFHAGRAALLCDLEQQAKVRFAHAAALCHDQPSFRFALGNTLRHAGALDAAVQAYHAALASASPPHDARILYNLGLTERERGNTEIALRHFELAATGRPRHYRSHYMIGICAFEMARYERARDALLLAIRQNRKDPRPPYQLALVLLALGENTEGIELLLRILRMENDFAPAHYALGRALCETEPARAREHLREAALGVPPVPHAHLELARIHDRGGNLREARAEYILFLRHAPPNEPHRNQVKRRLQAIADM